MLLIGRHWDGRGCSEATKTVVLCQHGASIVSRHKLSPEQELILRLPERHKEAVICVIGQMGCQNGSYTYGVEFCDPNLNFWEIEFPPLAPEEIEAGLLSLVCSSCKTLEKINGTGIEADVCAANDGVLRFCKRCGTSTLWRPVLTVMNQESASAEAEPFPLSSAPGIPASPQPPAPPGAVLTLSPHALANSPAPRAQRRKHSRVKVTYSACIRNPEGGDDIVTCQNMSKAGLCFKSSKQYSAQCLIEVAVPYAPGQPAIFVPGQIVFVEELPEQRLFCCGVQYIKPSKPRD